MNICVVLEPDGNPLSPDCHPVILPGTAANPAAGGLPPSPHALTLLYAVLLFNTKTSVVFLPSPPERRSYLELTVLDRPKLPTRASEMLVDLDILLRSAHISTIG